MTIQTKDFEIFSGTGGVGKTTLAASRAIHLAKQGKSVLLITIDPAKRLRDLLNLSVENAGEIVKVENPLNEDETLDLNVQLMNPEATFSRIAHKSQCPEVLDNRILKILTKPYGGLNEILAIVELNMQFQSKKFDVIVLDTPPGSHFLDFLDSVERIKVFFDQSFIEIFQYLGKKLDTSKYNVGKKMMNIIMSSGIKKLLSYLNKVTGDKFIDDFIEAIIAIYKTKATFLEALDLQQTIKNDSYSNWYLVTSVEQNKLQEALELKNHAKGHFTDKSYIAINKCMGPELVNWETVENSQTHQLKNSLKERENKLKNNLNKHFNNVLEFPEIFEISPIEHIRKLTHSWRRYGEV